MSTLSEKSISACSTWAASSNVLFISLLLIIDLKRQHCRPVIYALNTDALKYSIEPQQWTISIKEQTDIVYLEHITKQSLCFDWTGVYCVHTVKDGR